MLTSLGAAGQRSSSPSTPAAHGGRRPYRPEIDGLRAFAVIAVILNHVDSRILPSGYLGVDIFFVISGYVITLSLLGKGMNTGLGNFLGSFYERRSKRLLPALACFCLVFILAIGIFNPEPNAMIRTGASALVGVSNLYLLKSSTDYFSQAANLNPFTHTWSLAVEEQFYLVFPLLVWFTGLNKGASKSGIHFLIVAGILSVLSLISFVVLYSTNQAAAYFLMPTRFWEMAAGGLVLVALKQREDLACLLKKVPSALVLAAISVLMLLPLAAAVPATIATVAFLR